MAIKTRELPSQPSLLPAWRLPGQPPAASCSRAAPLPLRQRHLENAVSAFISIFFRREKNESPCSGPNQSSLTEGPWYFVLGTVWLYHFVARSMAFPANELEDPILKLERNS